MWTDELYELVNEPALRFEEDVRIGADSKL